MADPNYHTPGDIDILLGASIFWELLGPKKIKSSKRSPILQQTYLNWIISGNIQSSCNQQHSNKTHCNIFTNAEIQKQLEKFWQMEEIIAPQHYSKEESKCEKHFVETHSRNEEDLFIIQLPLKDGVENLGKSYKIIEKRLKLLERKLEKQPNLK